MERAQFSVRKGSGRGRRTVQPQISLMPRNPVGVVSGGGVKPQASGPVSDAHGHVSPRVAHPGLAGSGHSGKSGWASLRL